jgi:hypothetical protein
MARLEEKALDHIEGLEPRRQAALLLTRATFSN